MSRPRIEEVPKSSFTEAVWAISDANKKVSASDVQAVLNAPNAALSSQEEHTMIAGLTDGTALTLAATKVTGFGVFVGGDMTDYEDEDCLMLDYFVQAQLMFPQTKGGLHHTPLYFFPVLTRSTVQIDGGTGQVYTQTSNWQLLPDSEVRIEGPPIVSATVAEQRVYISARGTIALQKDGQNENGGIGVGWCVHNRDAAQSWDLEAVRTTVSAHLWRSDLRTINPNI